MPSRAPVYKAAPMTVSYNWTGWYAGVNVGGVWGSTNTTANLNFAPEIAVAGTVNLRGSGFTAGGQLGYNWQFNNIVTGLEADIGYTSINASRSAPVPGFVNQVDQSFKSNWLGTFRGRLGLAWDRSFLYVTGGLALADVNLNDTIVRKQL